MIHVCILRNWLSDNYNDQLKGGKVKIGYRTNLSRKHIANLDNYFNITIYLKWKI